MRQVIWYLSRLLAVVLVAAVVTLPACSTGPSPTTPTPSPSPAPSPSPTPTPKPSPTATPTPTPTATPTPTPPAYTIKTANKASIGDYLVDAKGMTLYYFTRDTIGKSTAVGGTLAAWPLFSPASVVVPPSLNAGDFGTITRDDGLKVATYKGWPLYYFARDAAPGDVNGEGVGGVWFVIKVPFYTVMIETKADVGNYLIDPRGMTLYLFTKDEPGKSTATAAVIANWPVFNASNFVLPSTVNSSDFGTITRDDGSKQSTYQGKPLYYYVQDKASGDTKGQGVGGVWYVMNVAPTLKITQPAGGVVPQIGDVTVKIQVANFNIVDKQGQAAVPGEGHVHYFLDVDAPTTAGKPAIPASGVWAHVASTNNTFSNVGGGPHKFSVELVNNDHTPLVPPVVATVSVSVLPEIGLPSLAILSPKEGSAVPVGDVPVSVQVSNFNVVDKQGQLNASHEGHIHFYLDVEAPTTAGQPAIPTGGVWAHVSSTNYTFASVPVGMHTIWVELVNNDHTPLVPPVVSKVTISLTAGAAPTPTPPGGSVTINLTASGMAFNMGTISVPAGAKVTVNFNNMDSGIPHNFAVYTNASATTSIFAGQIVSGPKTVAYTFTAPATPGTYFFRCDIHPTIMVGSFVVNPVSSGGGSSGGSGY